MIWEELNNMMDYLEKVFLGNLSKASRILRILRFHAHDLNMIPSITAYRQIGCKRPLRFSKSGDKKLEEAYSRHFRLNISKTKPLIDGQVVSTMATTTQMVQETGTVASSESPTATTRPSAE